MAISDFEKCVLLNAHRTHSQTHPNLVHLLWGFCPCFDPVQSQSTNILFPIVWDGPGVSRLVHTILWYIRWHWMQSNESIRYLSLSLYRSLLSDWFWHTFIIYGCYTLCRGIERARARKATKKAEKGTPKIDGAIQFQLIVNLVASSRVHVYYYSFGVCMAAFKYARDIQHTTHRHTHTHRVRKSPVQQYFNDFQLCRSNKRPESLSPCDPIKYWIVWPLRVRCHWIWLMWF